VTATNTIKAEKKQDRAQKEAMKTLPQLRKEAQKAFNDWVRARDYGNACICCGKYPQSGEALKGGQWDAGHYRGRGANIELSFHEDNCHLQLKRCNSRAWDVASYRANLLAKIGQERLDALEGYHPPKKYTRDDLRAIRDDCRARTRLLLKERE
jgi:hypothetical protein